MPRCRINAREGKLRLHLVEASAEQTIGVQFAAPTRSRPSPVFSSAEASRVDQLCCFSARPKSLRPVVSTHTTVASLILPPVLIRLSTSQSVSAFKSAVNVPNEAKLRSSLRSSGTGHPMLFRPGVDSCCIRVGSTTRPD